MTDDEIEGFFDDLTPEHFHQDSSSFVEMSRPNETFDAFVGEQVRATQIAYATAEGSMAPVAALVNAETLRMFVPQDEETLGDYLQRLHTESLDMDARWFYLARATQVASHLVRPEDLHDATQGEVVEGAKEANVLVDGLIWYAEARGEAPEKRMGIFYDNNDGVLERPIAVSGQQSALLEAVLAR